MGLVFSRAFRIAFSITMPSFFALACGASTGLTSGDGGERDAPGSMTEDVDTHPQADADQESDAGHSDTGHSDAGSLESDSSTLDHDAQPGHQDSGVMTSPNRSAGCGTAQTPGVNELSISVAGQTRTYLLSIPAGYDPNLAHPLVFGLHGLTGSGMTIRSRGLEMEEAMNTSVFVYPDGLPQPSFQNQTGWNLDPSGPDFAFIDALLQTAENEFCVDENRVFAFGFSFGGYLSNGLGCYRANKFRAIAPVEGALASFGPCMGTVAALVDHNMDDPTVTITQGEAARDHWIMSNGCNAGSTMPYPPAPSGNGWTCVTYQGCDAQHPVAWCLNQTGGHGWNNPPANLAIWSFFTMLP